jgi:hypothetical protein
MIYMTMVPFIDSHEGGWVRQNTTVVGSYLLVRWWLRVSTVLGHLQVNTFNNIGEKKTYTQLILGLQNNSNILHAKPKFCTRSLLRTPDHPKSTVYMFSLQCC